MKLGWWNLAIIDKGVSFKSRMADDGSAAVQLPKESTWLQ
jgi:hypothetical protein